MEDALSLPVGVVFARDFRIERPLAQGGMGAVYVVQQLSTGRLRALKLMHPDLARDEGARRRFVLEAQVGARIQSEHVVEVHTAGIDEASGAPYLVMELLEGEDLATRLERGGAMDDSLARELFRQMCHALGAAHAEGIVHRDLKPQNIFLAEHRRVDVADFEVKVLDFGIAKLTAGDATSGSPSRPAQPGRSKAMTRGMIGTPLWMAPEQTEAVPVTPAADVWALGLILYTVLTGRSYWRTGEGDGGTIAEILREVMFEPLPKPTARARQQGVAERFPVPLEAIFNACVARDPAARFPDATSFWLALDGALTGRASLVSARGGARTVIGDATLDVAGRDPALDATVASQPELQLELAVEPRRRARAEPPPSPTATTIGARANELRPTTALGAAPAGARPVLAEPRWKAPWWLVFSVPLAISVGFFVIGKQQLTPPKVIALCRLCTIESKTHANGPLELREVRANIEGAFPELDARCIAPAEGPGRVTLQFTVSGGDVLRSKPSPRSSSNDKASRCILDFVTHRQYGIVLAGPTEITYTLEWDPHLDR